MTANEIKLALETRGARLARPPSAEELSSLLSIKDFDKNPLIKELYSAFDGFVSADKRSQIFMWPISRVLEERKSGVVINGRSYFPFGDWMVYSDLIMWCPENKNAPVLLLYERRTMGSSIGDFFDNFVGGKFDFIV